MRVALLCFLQLVPCCVKCAVCVLILMQWVFRGICRTPQDIIHMSLVVSPVVHLTFHRPIYLWRPQQWIADSLCDPVRKSKTPPPLLQVSSYLFPRWEITWYLSKTPCQVISIHPAGQIRPSTSPQLFYHLVLSVYSSISSNMFSPKYCCLVCLWRVVGWFKQHIVL